jgi:hypothetical protein
MDIETIKNVTSIAAPLTKIVLDTFLVPKFDELKKKWKREDKIFDHFFEDKFTDYLNETYEKNCILNTIAFKKKEVFLNDVYIPLRLRCSESNEIYLIDKFNEDIFKTSNRVLITDSAGMGKSTLSKKLLLSCIENNIGVPVLIELRRLSKSKGIIDEILEQLNPINEILDKQFILDLVKRGDFIFFLDGFDEIQLDERTKVTNEIQQFITKANKNKFILTSRPENALTSFGNFKKFQIRPLEIEEAFSLLKKYDNNGNLSSLLINKIQEDNIFENIKEYLTTPLLVSLLFTAFEHKQTIPFKKHIFYRQVFDALYESPDLSNGDSFERDKYSGLGIDEFLRILRIFGYLCLVNNNKIEFTQDQLEEIIQKSLNYCGSINVQPSKFIKDLLITVPLFSIDGIYYKWSHKSLQEYFASQFIYLDSKEKQSEILKRICFHKNNEIYLNIIDLYESIDPKGFKEIIVKKLISDYLNFIKTTYKDFKNTDKLERQQLEFCHDIYLINFPFKPEIKENHPSELFKLMRDSIKDKRMSIGINVIADEKDISCIKVPKIDKPFNTLMKFLYEKNYDFIESKDFKPTCKIVNLKLVPNKVYSLTDRKNLILNKDENFTKTNEIIKYFLGRSPLLIIDIEKAKKVLSEIEQTVLASSSDSFLLNF